MASLILSLKLVSGNLAMSDGDQRGIFRFDPGLAVNRELYTLSGQTLHDLFHGVQFLDSGVCHNADPLRAHVLEVHPHLFCATRSEPNARGGHLEGIFLLSRSIHRCSETPFRMVEDPSGWVMMTWA